MKDYKDTLNMPYTDFPMRGALGQKEPEIQKVWDENNLYQERIKLNEGKKTFVIHDGPPYANGNIHTGHALNKCLKDFVIRYKNMNGFICRYVPGWDTHGLPIENALTKTGNINRKTMPVSEFRDLCKEYALKQVDNQRIQFKRLGVLGEWENPYLTLRPQYEASQVRVFAQMVEKGLIYKGLKPVYWSPSSESALAEAEIEYHDLKSPSIFVIMKVVDGKDVLDNETYLMIWTTTPWTIPANLAVCAGPEITYGLYQVNDKKIVLACDLAEKVLHDELGFEYTLIKQIKGHDLELITYKHPLYERISPVILGDHVTTTDGTGLVHTAPGHGEDDYNVGVKYNLDVYCPVDSHGKLDESTGRFKGLFVFDADKEVVNALEECGALMKLKFITHSYPHDWRTNKPIIFRATPQWFASIESLKEDMLKAINTVKWYPAWGNIRLSNMIKDREAWCISRQRAWGVPIPVFYNEDGSEILDKDVILHVAEIFEKEGSNAWFKMTAKELLPEGYTNPLSPNGNFTKETDIMDVWFDSGTSHHGGMLNFGLTYPADLYLEGSDQYRGWFNSSLSTGVASMGIAPYKTIVSHGFILDNKGNKMSKSLGNVIDPNKICSQMGADILRLWVSSVDYQQDVPISDDLMNQVAESYRKIRNTFKFLLGNLHDFNYEKDMIEYEKLGEVDKYILIKLNDLVKVCLDSYEDYQFDNVYRKINNFVSFVSAFYLDYIKDILYIEKENNETRRSIQTVLYNLLSSLLRLLTPIIPHTASEVYSYYPLSNKKDVYLMEMPKVLDLNEDVIPKMEKFMNLRLNVLHALEQARSEKIIGKSLNAHLILYPNAKTKELLDSLNFDLKQVFIVSKITVKEGEGKYAYDDLSIDVEKCDGVTCARCWQIVDHVHEDELCDRCEKIVNE